MNHVASQTHEMLYENTTRYPLQSSGQKISAQTGYVMDGIQEAVGELIVALKASSNRLLKMIEKSRNDLKRTWLRRTVQGSADGRTFSNQNQSSHIEQVHHSCANENGKNQWKETSEDNKLIYKMFSKNLTDNMVFLGIEKIYSESTTKDLSDNIKVLIRPN